MRLPLLLKHLSSPAPFLFRHFPTEGRWHDKDVQTDVHSLIFVRWNCIWKKRVILFFCILSILKRRHKRKLMVEIVEQSAQCKIKAPSSACSPQSDKVTWKRVTSSRQTRSWHCYTESIYVQLLILDAGIFSATKKTPTLANYLLLSIFPSKVQTSRFLAISNFALAVRPNGNYQ